MRRRRTQANKRVKGALLVFGIIILFFLGFKLSKFIGIGLRVISNKGINLKETPDHRINILLLGVGGGTHDGPDLTDTIMLASINPASKSAVLVSLPRDLWSPELQGKINTAYTIGEEKQKGGGLILAKSMIGKILGQQIDYAAKLDFNGFVKAIDDVGGLDITVDRSFDDYQYPITGREDDLCGHSPEEIQQIATSEAELQAFPCRYEHLHFNTGLQHMNGTTALKFVRSRHAEGPEGSDFARSKRQQKIIDAFKQKLFSAGTILNPVRIFQIINDLKGSIDTDITESDYSEFIKLAQQMKGLKTKTAVIDTGDTATGREGLLYNPPTSSDYNYAWVLIPTAGNGNYTQIQSFVQCQLNNCQDETPKPSISQKKN
jgi:LCP family protein required for cell wall assembly